MIIHSVQGGGGVRLHVREWGNASAPSVLFIHGWSQNHLCWEKRSSYREPSGKAPVIHPGDEPPFLYGDGSGWALHPNAEADRVNSDENVTEASNLLSAGVLLLWGGGRVQAGPPAHARRPH